MEKSTPKEDARFVIPLPGGRVARVPASVLEQHVEGGALSVHHAEGDHEDVTAHSLSVDPSTGMSDWHTDWEHGECDYTDESGFPQRIQAWHRHPFGTEYTELYEG
jgi:hypothetical protein